jgi:DNA-binding response OmpR family regulator
MKILIVEDDAAIVRSLKRILAAYGHVLVGTESGEEGARLAADESVEFVLLDISLPGIDGHEVLERIRAVRPGLPVLMLTARDDLENKVVALRSGADDYLTKPFAFEELMARIEALSRRVGRQEPVEIHAGDLRVDLLARRLWRGEKEIELSPREFVLLEYFARRPGEELTRQRILSEIWGYDFDPGSNVLDVYVRHLRHKIDRPGEQSSITAIRGVGYRFDPPPA